MMTQVSPTHTASPTSVLIAPTPPSVRFELIDIIRGFALYGVLLANMVWTTQWFALTNTQRAALPIADIDLIVQPIILMLVDLKFYTLFSMLFGLGFAMQLSRAAERGRKIIPVYSRRLAILFFMGVAHTLLLWFGDILHTYALVGFVLILFRKRSDRFLLGCAFVITVVFALFPFYHCITMTNSLTDIGARRNPIAERFAIMTGNNWFEVIQLNWGFIRNEYTSAQLKFDSSLYWYLSVLSKFLIGFVIGRRMLLQEAEKHLGLFRRLLPWALMIGIVGSVYMSCAEKIFDVWIPGSPSAWISLSWVFVEISMFALSIAYLSGLVLLYQRPGWRLWLQHLAPVGRMALTNYLSQSIFLVVLFYGVGFGLLGKIGATGCVVLSVVLFGFQIAMSGWWLNRFRFGPAEWLWRCLTYGKRISMRLVR